MTQLVLCSWRTDAVLVTTKLLRDSTAHDASGSPHDASSICLVAKLLVMAPSVRNNVLA